MTGTTQLHSYSAQFPEPFQLPLQVLVSSQLSLSLCLSFRCQMDKQSIIRHFCSISFNTGLLCSILLSICILKSHGSLCQWIHTLVVDHGCCMWSHTCTLVVAHVIHVKLFVTPVIIQHSTYKISPSALTAPSCLPYNIDIAFEQVSCILGNTIWLIASSLSLPFYTLPAHFACQWSL